MSIVANDTLIAGIPVWRYLYNATFANYQPLPGLGVFHGSEGRPPLPHLLHPLSHLTHILLPILVRTLTHFKPVPIIFGNLPNPANATAFELALSKYMQRVWANFAKNPFAGPPWPRYPAVGVLGTMNHTEFAVSATDLDTRCAFLNPVLGDVPSGGS